MTAHDTSIDDRELERSVAERFRIAMGLDEPPETVEEWADETANLLREAGFSLGVEEMCLADASRHEARVGEETKHFACVLDALLVPFVRGNSAAVTVRSRSPVSDRVVEMDVSRETIDADPNDAVVSLGMAIDTESPEDRGGVLAGGRAHFCRYVNAFADEAEYDRWTEETPAAVTTALSVEEAHALAERLGDRLAE